MVRKRFNSFKDHKLALGLVLAGGMLLTVGGYGLWDYWRVTTQGEPDPSTGIVTTSNSNPSERRPKPMEKSTYTVPGDQPRRIQIPSISVDAYIGRVGVAASGEMATPNNIFFAGWYVNSVTPGAKGISILNGHAGGRYRDGVFRHLNKLDSNDTIKIQMGNMSWRTFTVVSTKKYPVGQAKEPLFNANVQINGELHLITCDGSFDDSTRTYNERTIVVARYIET